MKEKKYSSDKKPLVSIIVPIYGVEEYLRECLDSIVNQSYSNIEILLIDDGSKDLCPEICDEYANKDKRITVIHKKNEGLVSARKTGVKIAKGEFVQFVDGDDWINYDMTERMVNYAIKYDADLVTCGLYICKKDYTECIDKFPEGLYHKDMYKSKIIPNMIYSGRYFEFGIFPSLCNKLFYKEKLIPFVMAVDNLITLGEDGACLYPYLLSIDSIYISHDVLYYYRQNNNSMTKSFISTQVRDTYNLLNYLHEVFETKKNQFPELLQQLDYYSLFWTECNLVNEARAGVCCHCLKRWKNMYSFVKQINLKTIIQKCDLSSAEPRSKLMLKMASHVSIYALMIYQALKHYFVR